MSIVCGLAGLVVGYIPASRSTLVTPDKTKLQGTVRSGLTTTDEATQKTDLGPFGLRVTWIAWDSGFRGTDLRIGDRIVGVDDHHYTRAEMKELLSHGSAIGKYAESQYWEKRAARAYHPQLSPTRSTATSPEEVRG